MQPFKANRHPLLKNGYPFSPNHDTMIRGICIIIITKKGANETKKINDKKIKNNNDKKLDIQKENFINNDECNNKSADTYVGVCFGL